MDWKPEKDTDSGKIVSEYEYISFFCVVAKFTQVTFCHMPFEIVANCQESGKILPVCLMQVEILVVFFIPVSYMGILKIVPVITCRMTSCKLPCRLCTVTIDLFHKWLPIINSFVIIKISLTNLVFELIIQKNFYSQTSSVFMKRVYAATTMDPQYNERPETDDICSI